MLLTCSYLTKILRNWRKCEWRVWIRWLPNVWSLKSPGESALLSTCTVTDDTPTKSSVNLQKDPSCGVFCEPFSNIEIGVTNCQVPTILIQNVRILLVLSSQAWEWKDIWCSKHNYCIYLTWANRIYYLYLICVEWSSMSLSKKIHNSRFPLAHSLQGTFNTHKLLNDFISIAHLYLL